ncbi:hypothetical protein CI1B_47290 [Bradyrhizobium ivorense]|uniref:DUF4142 domain-containing protein n=1 Tax=Bradyrhizobium ivorense TaxID=2511166 RepID=A0A508TCD8_9BRAD|nr:hypothetical protein CI1B_47290 [Bradyrhizobium ivorense]
MKRTILAIAIGCGLAFPALAQSVGEKTGVNSVLGIAPKTEDFIKEVAMSDMLEIEAAKIAQQKGNAAEKKFADQMVKDHTKTSTELKDMVSGEMKSALPTSLTTAPGRSSGGCATPRRRISPSSTIRCKSARTRMRSRCSNATPKAATIKS